MADDSGGGSDQPIIIKKIVQGGGHHGGAWKVAYADFVTAMMAFFLLLWLLNVSTEEQLEGISDYFSPAVVSSSTSGAGGVMGGSTLSPDGARTSDTTPLIPPPSASRASDTAIRDTDSTAENPSKSQSKSQDVSKEAAEAEIKRQEEQSFNEAKDALEQAIAGNPDLAGLTENLVIDMTPEGLRIQVIDAEGKPMFASGSARMFARTQKLLSQVAKAIQSMPNEISVRGHTDSIPYGAGADYTNWELSSDRANASRRILQESDIPPARLNDVVGKADTDPLLVDDPTSPRNRRISIVLLRESITNPEEHQQRVKALAAQKAREASAATDGEAPAEEPDVPDFSFDAPAESPTSLPAPESSGSYRKSDGDIKFP